MSVEVLDGATIVGFVEDEEAFNVSIRDRFAYLDTDHDGLLSYAEMLEELKSLRVFETHFGIDEKPDPDELASVYNSLFVQFDHDSNGTVDLEEFKAETKQMMLAMANGLGFLPVQMLLEQDSFLKKPWRKSPLLKRLIKSVVSDLSICLFCIGFLSFIFSFLFLAFRS